VLSLCIKFEVSNFIHYEDMNDDAKYRKLVGLGWLGVTQGHRQCRHTIEHIRLLFNSNRHYVSISYRLRDIASYLSKVADFHLPVQICRPGWG